MPTSGATKTKAKKTIGDLEREEILASAALLRTEADLLSLEDQQEQLKVRRAAVSSKTAGGKTQAILALEELDKEAQALARSVMLATSAISEAEADLQAARDALADERQRVAAERERRERERLQRDLRAAEDALQEARRKLEALPGRPGDRLGRRVATILGKWLPPSVRPVVPEPPLASPGATPELTKKGDGR